MRFRNFDNIFETSSSASTQNTKNSTSYITKYNRDNQSTKIKSSLRIHKDILSSFEIHFILLDNLIIILEEVKKKNKNFNLPNPSNMPTN